MRAIRSGRINSQFFSKKKMEQVQLALSRDDEPAQGFTCEQIAHFTGLSETNALSHLLNLVVNECANYSLTHNTFRLLREGERMNIESRIYSFTFKVGTVNFNGIVKLFFSKRRDYHLRIHEYRKQMSYYLRSLQQKGLMDQDNATKTWHITGPNVTIENSNPSMCVGRETAQEAVCPCRR